MSDPVLSGGYMGPLRIVLLAAMAALATPCDSSAQSPRALHPVLDLRIDGAAMEFSRIVHVSVAQNGTIIVAQPDDGQLRYFSAAGKDLGFFGRRGEGPGEFQSLGVYRGWLGELFWQGNVMPPRAVVVSPERRLARSVLLPPIRPSARFGFHSLAGMLPGGDLLVAGTILRAASNPAWANAIRDSMATVVLRVDSTGLVRRLVAVTPALQAGCKVSVNGRIRPVPACATWYGNLAPDGSTYAWVSAPAVDAQGRGSVRITSISTKGDTIFSKPYPVLLEAVSRAVADSIRRDALAGITNALLQQDYRDIPLPKFLPPVRGIVIGRDGRIWIGLRETTAGRPWSILNRAGSPVATITLPFNVRLEAADATHCWGVENDEDGVGSVVRYRLSR